jgi:hypothetical protein
MIAETLISPAIVGDVVTIDGRIHVAREKCDETGSAFYCLPCHQLLANLYQLELHLEDGQPHCIARNCRYHGLESL